MGMPNTIRLERLSQLLKVTKLQKKAYAKREAAKLNGTYAFFDMDFWFIKVNEKYVKEGFCSSAACVLGSAALHPWFKKRGLHVELFKMEDMEDIGGAPHGVPLNRTKLMRNCWGEKVNFSIRHGNVKYRGKENIEAAEDFFGISYEEAQWLFDPASYGEEHISPTRVIKHIEDVIAHYKDGKDSRAYQTAMLEWGPDSAYNIE